MSDVDGGDAMLMSFNLRSLLSLSLQMVQAIQVLRFHLLELEKVSVERFKCANNPPKKMMSVVVFPANRFI